MAAIPEGEVHGQQISDVDAHPESTYVDPAHVQGEAAGQGEWYGQQGEQTSYADVGEGGAEAHGEAHALQEYGQPDQVYGEAGELQGYGQAHEVYGEAEDGVSYGQDAQGQPVDGYEGAEVTAEAYQEVEPDAGYHEPVGQGNESSSGFKTLVPLEGEEEGHRSQVFSWCRHQRLKEVEATLDTGFPIDEQDENGNTLLFVAAQNGLKQAARLCLRRGASVNLQNHRGNTPLHYCFAYGHSALAAYLIEKGADDGIVNADGLTVYEGTAKTTASGWLAGGGQQRDAHGADGDGTPGGSHGGGGGGGDGTTGGGAPSAIWLQID